jgi:RNA polymerase sigma factor (sigma-70 family)
MRSPQALSRRFESSRPNPGAEIAALFDQHGRMVVALCRALLRDPEDAEDAAQQSFLNAHRALLNGTRPVDPPAWLATIARNECRARISARLTRPRPVPLSEDVAELRPASDPASQADRRAEIQAFTAALTELPERQREAVVLRDVHGLSYQEVAVAMSVSPPAVESLLSRARRTLEARVRPVRVAQGVPLVLDSLRSRLEVLIPDFTSPEATTAVASGVGGIAAKVISLQFVGKAVATSAVAVVTLGVGAEVAVNRYADGRSTQRATSEVLVDSHAVQKTPAVAKQADRRAKSRVSSRTHGESRPTGVPIRDAAMPSTVEDAAPTRTAVPPPATASPAQDAPDDSGQHEAPEAFAPTEGGSSNSGPGSSSSGPGPSGSGESGSSGSGSSGSDSSGPGGGGGSSGPGSSSGSDSGHSGGGGSDSPDD